ncbi:MAG: peptide chain release factor N(5)-glutamine methyltransferase [Bifidobacteriaceae bacterium]|jgi:release factor glutamine methyltransferase|nr:peptide chain release factor N(5)-glutamine methyltransferase [Bifidobacteriaceae bacterium]
MTALAAALVEATERLAAAGVPTPRVDAEVIAAHLWEVTPGRLRALVVADLADDDAPRLARFAAAIARRAERVPLQHITRIAPFRTLELAVGPGVFIPRPETEVTAGLAIDAARKAARPRVVGLGSAGSGASPASGARPRVVDLGTGSGAIAAAIATEVPYVQVTAVESDPAAHAWAQRNLVGLPVTLLLADAADAPATRPVLPRADPVSVDPGGPAVPADPAPATSSALPRGDRVPPLRAVAPDLFGVTDVVVTNPPYIPDGCRPLDPEVELHDPPAALYGGGADGLMVPAAIVRTAAALLRAGGVLVMEHGADQGPAMRALAERHGFTGAVTHRDLAGRDRVLRAVRARSTCPPSN